MKLKLHIWLQEGRLGPSGLLQGEGGEDEFPNGSQVLPG